jgi:hypothetical protein
MYIAALSSSWRKTRLDIELWTLDLARRASSTRRFFGSI